MDILTSTTLSKLMASANITQYGDLANLSIDQINALIESISKQLTNEEIVITQTNSVIAAAQLSIHGAGGLQEKFNAADSALTIAQSNYDRANSIFAASKNTLFETEVELSTLSSAMNSIVADISTFESDYSLLQSTISWSQSTVNGEQARYTAEMDAYNKNIIDRSTAIAILQSTTLAYDYTSTLYEQVLERYITTSTTANTLQLDYIRYSTGTYALSRSIAQSTALYYSSLLKEEQLDLQIYLSTSTSLHIARLNYSTALATGQYNDAVLTEVCTIARYDAAATNVLNISQILGVPYPFIVPSGHQLTAQQEMLKSLYFPSTSLTDLTIEGQYYTAQESLLSTNLTAAILKRQELQAGQNTLQLITLQAILDAANRKIRAAEQTLFEAQMNESYVQSTVRSLTEQITGSYALEEYYISTLNSMSTSYSIDLTRWYGQSTTVGLYNIQNILISDRIRTTTSNIERLVLLSTMYNMSVSIYQSTYTWYSTLDGQTQSSIAGYTLEDSTINGTIGQLQADIEKINISTINAVTDLKLYRDQFYSFKLQGLMYQAQEYQYAVQELSATTGAVTAQLLSNKISMFTQIDTLNMKITANPGDNASIQQRANVMANQNTIQTIIDAINPLDTQFNTVVGYSLQEQQYISQFIDLRTQLTTTEIVVLEGNISKAVAKSNYQAVWATMNETITSINGVISQKNGVLASIYSVLNAYVPQITTLYPSMTFPDTITVDQSPIQLQSDNPNQSPLSEFAILAPIDFTTP